MNWKAKEVIWLETDYGDWSDSWDPRDKEHKTLESEGTLGEVGSWKLYDSGISYKGKRVYFYQNPGGPGCFYFPNAQDEQGFLTEAKPPRRALNSALPASTNLTVRNALKSRAARNSAYTDFGIFKDFTTYAKTELFSFLPKFNEVAASLKRQAEASKRGSKKKLEHDYIDTCLEKCLAALKEAHDRVQRQTTNVMQ